MSLTALYCMCVAEGYTTMYIFFNTIFGNTICQTWSKQLENEGIGNCLWGGGGGGVLYFSSPCQRQCELLPSLGVRRRLTFHILIFS